MKIASENLELLAEIFSPAPLYAVGGRVRNFVLTGTAVGDFDISSALTPDEVAEKLSGTGFSVSAEYKRFGTLLLSKDGEQYEYTCFRRDSYKSGGGHCPESVEFTDSVSEDAFRRDFRINALYFDIKTKEIVDPTGGLRDLAERRISAATDAEKTFSEDALRILRLARFAAELGFEIERETLQAAKKRAHTLADISPERKKDELEKILYADKKYGVADAHYRGLKLLSALGAWKYVIPPVADCEGAKQNPRHHRYDVAEHIFQTVRIAPESLRLAALMHDTGKAEALRRNNGVNSAGHDVLGEEYTRKYLEELGFGRKITERTARLVRTHMFDLFCDVRIEKVRLFIAENADIIEDLITLKRADAIASGTKTHSPSGERLEAVYAEMRGKGVPLSLKELKIDGRDVTAAGSEGKAVGEILDAVLHECVTQEKYLSREEQLARTKFFTEKLK